MDPLQNSVSNPTNPTVPTIKSDVSETSQSIQEPKKRSSIVNVLLVLVFIMLIGGIIVFGYLYIKKDSDYKKVVTEKQDIESEKATLTAEKTTLEGENATLKEENANIALLQEDIDSYKDHEAKIKVYNDVIDYVFQIVKKHNGFNGWTDAEYQEGRRIAEAAGDEEFLEQIDSAWNDKQISQLTRFLTFMDFVTTRINDNLVAIQ